MWVYHSPPAGTVLCRDGRREFPDHDLAAWIEEYQPDVVHLRPHPPGAVGQGRLVARAARPHPGVQRRQADRATCPPHITFDTEARTAHWFGVFDSETIDLG